MRSADGFPWLRLGAQPSPKVPTAGYHLAGRPIPPNIACDASKISMLLLQFGGRPKARKTGQTTTASIDLPNKVDRQEKINKGS